jgi:hypothetical protein
MRINLQVLAGSDGMIVLWLKPPHGAGLVSTGLYLLLPVIHINLQVLAVSDGMIVLWLNRVYLETRELNPRSSIFDQRKSQLHHFTIGFQKPGICTILPLDSRNQESAQIPGFWNPMVKWCNWFLESNGKMVQLKSTSGSNRAGWMVQASSHREEDGDVLLNVLSLNMEGRPFGPLSNYTALVNAR